MRRSLGQEKYRLSATPFRRHSAAMLSSPLGQPDVAAHHENANCQSLQQIARNIPTLSELRFDVSIRIESCHKNFEARTRSGNELA